MSMWSSHIPNLEVKSILPTLWGCDGEGENQDQSGTGGAGTGEQQSSGEQPNGAGENGGESQGDPQKKIAAQEEIIARLAQQREERDAELEELKKFKEEADNAKLSEQEKVDKRIKELEESNTAKDQTLQKLVINNAFLTANDVQWHDAETALSLLDTSGFEIVVDKNGIPSVKDKQGFAKAIAKLAEDKSYLVKTPANEGDGKGPQQWQGKTGDAPKPKPNADSAERQRLQDKYPALRGR